MHASIQEIQTACYTVLIQPTPPKLLAIECARVLVCERVCTCAQMAGEVERHAPHERVLVLLLLLVVVVVLVVVLVVVEMIELGGGGVEEVESGGRGWAYGGVLREL